MTERKSENITWHAGQVGRSDREVIVGQRGVTIWLTGLSGSGKSTIAIAAERDLTNRGRLAFVLDGDNIRHGLNSNLGFSPEDRTENIRRIGEVSKLFTEAGVIVFSSFRCNSSVAAAQQSSTTTTPKLSSARLRTLELMH